CPLITGNHTSDGTGIGSFVSSITGLTAGTLYYVRAYATNSAGTSYGNEFSFTTLPIITPPTVTTTAVSSITQTAAASGGNVTSDGGATVTARGVCWGTVCAPVITGNHTSDGTGSGSFVSSITGLTTGTTYYVRAYATNSAGTSYGNEFSFTTLTLPIVTTDAVTAVTQTTATSGGNVLSGGGATVTARGVCWSTAPSPTITGNHTSDGTGCGTFVSSITGLTAGSTYYVRAYATNCEGTSYGAQQVFYTLKSTSTLAKVTTNPVTNIKGTTATCGGNVISDGGAAVKRRGVCWNTTGNPTTSDSYTQDGTGTGAFTSYMTGLKSRTKYYVRAYATNINGTSYGNLQSFTTTRSNSMNDDPGDSTMISDVEPNTLKLYPNPVVSTLTLEYSFSEDSNVTLYVYNLNGTKLYSEQLNDQFAGAHDKKLNVSSFPVGLYIVVLTTDRFALRKNFIKID
ncbi:MAG: T9SS type A sorting domain-containing protein, partial [Bacteroidetes bacterium]|nr:T9SS type A sorting domain-containing protein [Bacteroidota bacterium]